MTTVVELEAYVDETSVVTEVAPVTVAVSVVSEGDAV